MADSRLVAYNPADKEQRSLLAAIQRGESGGNYSIGFGGVDLSSAARDQWGFPIWGGDRTQAGPTHAAGAYQFQPGTWEYVAKKYNLNFANPSDQDRGAWYLAQETYAKKTGGSLDEDLNAGKFAGVQAALSSVWSSVVGNARLPQGIAQAMSEGITAELAPGPTNSEGTPSLLTDPVGASKAYFVRGGMIIVGALILVVALWALLSKADIVPNVAKIGK